MDTEGYWLIGLVIIGIALVLFLLLLALGFLSAGLVGFGLIFTFAVQQGFLGVLAFFAAWIFIFPVMLIWAVVWGYLATRSLDRELNASALRSTSKPPHDPYERYKWANRLPPYDK